MTVIHINQNNFEKEVQNSSKPVIIDFWASWCGPCKMMAPVFEELSTEYEGTLKFAKLSTEEEPMLASQFGIQGIPTLAVFQNGKEVQRIVGFAPKEVMKQKIDEILESVK